MAENAITLAADKAASNLQTLFSKMKNVYYSKNVINSDTFADGLECDLEFPVVSDGVSMDTGSPDVTDVKLTTGVIWVSHAEKGNSDISFQVASIAGVIDDLFLTKKDGKGVSGISIMDIDGTFSGEAYSLDVNKVTGSLILTDDEKQTVIILTNVEMYGGLVVGDSDKPAYFKVKVTPKDNKDGAAIMILKKN